jgi:predicted RecA/RadA family phage recombinase
MFESVTTDQSTKIIVGLMGFAGVFSLVGHELTSSKNKPVTPKGSVSTGGRIILGTVLGTALLTLIAHAGEAGYKLATGLAALTAVSATLITTSESNLWSTISGAIGSVPTPQAPITTNQEDQAIETTGATALIV